jgi:hypothetical protein
MRRFAFFLTFVLAFAAFRSEADQPFPGLLGMTMPEAAMTDFFTFFHMTETGRQPAGSNTIVTFKPSGSDFQKLVTLRATLSGQRIAGLELDLSRAFINSRTQRAFANDIAKSLFTDGVPSVDRPALRVLSDEIESNKGLDRILLSGRESPATPAQESDGYLTYVGRRYTYSLAMTASSLHMENIKQGDEDWLQIQLTAKP